MGGESPTSDAEECLHSSVCLLVDEELFKISVHVCAGFVQSVCGGLDLDIGPGIGKGAV